MWILPIFPYIDSHWNTAIDQLPLAFGRLLLGQRAEKYPWSGEDRITSSAAHLMNIFNANSNPWIILVNWRWTRPDPLHGKFFCQKKKNTICQVGGQMCWAEFPLNTRLFCWPRLGLYFPGIGLSSTYRICGQRRVLQTPFNTIDFYLKRDGEKEQVLIQFK